MPPKILIILKRRHDYNHEKHININISTGLYNSAYFVNEMLNNYGLDSTIVVVVDNNCIDREVSKYKPTHVIIEALWVVPSKFHVLQNLHPNVKWIIRLHSEIPFLANEGMAFDWIGDYMAYDNVVVGANSKRTLKELRTFIKTKYAPYINKKTLNEKLVYLPNYYPRDFKYKPFNKDKDYVDVSCFGAIRPLKNHMLQAMAALKFAEKIDKKLHFHINTGRIEQKGDAILNNLQSFFGHIYNNGHRLINHGWAPREEFLKICGNVDIGMQVSFSETFNIVAADMLSQGVPLIGSNEIPWINPLFSSDATDSNKIANKLYWTYQFPKVNFLINKYLLLIYTHFAKKVWLDFFKYKMYI